jgi:quercetin dioxygenase-like cupin family protein
MSVKRTILEAIPIAGLPGYENRLVKLKFAPGVQGSLHTHPVPAIGYIIQGEYGSQWEDSEIEYFIAGDTIVNRANEKHFYTSNSSKTETLIILLSYAIKIGEPNIQPLQSRDIPYVMFRHHQV